MMQGALYSPDDDDVGIPMPGPTRVVSGSPAQPNQSWFQGVQQQVSNNSDLLLAAAAGIGKGTQMGDMFSAVQDHYQLQDQIKGRKEAQANAAKFKQEQLDETKRMNSAKMQGLAAKAARDGMPKKIGGIGGQTTLAWPDGSITSHGDDEVQSIYETAEAAKLARTELMANQKSQDLLATPAVMKLDGEKDTAVREMEKSLADFQRLQTEMTDSGGISFMSRALPNGLSASVNRILGTDDGKLQAGVAKLNMQGFVKMVSGFPGSLSNAEGARIEQALPKVDDDPELWKKFFSEFGPMLQADVENAKRHLAARQTQKEEIKARPSYTNGGKPKLMQQYPPGFTPPSNGRAAPGAQLEIIKGEYEAELKKSNPSNTNLQALRRELKALGYNPQEQAPVASPAAAAPTTRPPLGSFKR